MGRVVHKSPAGNSPSLSAVIGKIAGVLLVVGFAAGMTAAALPLRPVFFLVAALTAFTIYSVLVHPKWFLWGVIGMFPLRYLADESVQFGIASYFRFNLKGLPNILIIFAGLLYLLYKKRSAFSYNSARIFGLFLFIVLVSLAYTDYPADGAHFLIRIACPFGFFCIALGEIKDRDDMDGLLKAIVISSLVPLGVGLYQLISGTGYQDPVGLRRLQSLYEHPNAFSFYLVMLLCVLFTCLVRARTAPQRVAVLGGCLLATGLLVSTYCRSSWLAAIFVLIWFFIRHRERRGLLAVYFVISIAVAALLPSAGERMRSTVSVIQSEAAGNRPAGDAVMTHDSSTRWRLNVWKKLLRRIPEAPLFGHGAGSSTGFMEKAFALRIHPHNNYLLILYEYGLAGLVVFGAFLFLLARHGYRSIRTVPYGFDYPFVSLYGAALLSFMTIMLSDNIFEQSSSSLCFWTIFAIGEMIWAKAARKTTSG